MSNGDLLVGRDFNGRADEIGITEDSDFYTYIYEPDTNSVKSILTNNSKDSILVQVEENCIVFVKRKENAKTDTEYNYEFYDLDLAPIENSTFSFDSGSPEPEILVTPDNKSYIVGSDGNIYDSNGNVIHTIKSSGSLRLKISISKNGKYIYYCTMDEEYLTLHTIPLNGRQAYDDHEFSHIKYKGWELPLYFDSGNFMYLVFKDEDGEQQFIRLDIIGDEETIYGIPEDELKITDRNPDYLYNTYLTNDGKYLFLINFDDGPDFCVYDIENGLKKVYELKKNTNYLRRDGMNILYDENTGDVYLNSCHTGFNLFGKEYSNLGLS